VQFIIEERGSEKEGEKKKRSYPFKPREGKEIFVSQEIGKIYKTAKQKSERGYALTW